MPGSYNNSQLNSPDVHFIIFPLPFIVSNFSLSFTPPSLLSLLFFFQLNSSLHTGYFFVPFHPILRYDAAARSLISFPFPAFSGYGWEGDKSRRRVSKREDGTLAVCVFSGAPAFQNPPPYPIVLPLHYRRGGRGPDTTYTLSSHL